MGLLRLLARGYVLDRLLRRQRPPLPPHRYRSESPYGQSAGYPRRRRGRFGLFGPLPYYSTTTRRGARVSVGGCCLPIPLFLVATITAASLFLRRRWAGVRAGR